MARRSTNRNTVTCTGAWSVRGYNSVAGSVFAYNALVPPLQVLLNGLIAGSLYTLTAFGFALVYATSRFFHFAHGSVFAAAAYLAFALTVWAGLQPLLALPLAVVGSAVLGGAIEVAVYKPLRTSGASSVVFLLASMGVFVMLQSLVSIVFGDDSKGLGSPDVGGVLHLRNARLTPVQALALVFAVVLWPSLWLMLNRTRFGLTLRAAANDPELARAKGVNLEHLHVWVILLGSALASTAGIITAYDTGMRPTMAFEALLVAVVTTVMGGLGSATGVLAAGCAVGFIQHLGAWYISAEWQDAILFLVLLLLLLARPTGLFGRTT
jgi:branched-chain amino acid transport system permease protein